jgi:hypothetical protein
MTNPDPIVDALRDAARGFDLDGDLVVAIATVESGLDPRKWRHEPAYPYLWDMRANGPFHPLAGVAEQRTAPPGFTATRGVSSATTEWIGQQSSWGLMQVMGAVAREAGFRGPFPGLCDPAVGAHYGCWHLSRLWARFFPQGGPAAVAAAYNGGTPVLADPRDPSKGYRNQEYVDRVRAAWRQLTTPAAGGTLPTAPIGDTP